MLKKQLVPIVLEGGVEQKIDKKVSIPGKLYLLENAIRRKAGKLQKRAGSKRLGSSPIGTGGDLSDADALAVFNGELLKFVAGGDLPGAYAYSPSADGWISRGSAQSCKLTTSTVVSNNYEQTQVDSAVLGNIHLSAFEDTRGGVRYSVTDLSSGTSIVADSQVSASGTRPRCAALKGHLFVFYVVSSDLRVREIFPFSATPLGDELTLTSNVNGTTSSLDLCVQNEFMVLAYNGTGTNVYILKVNEELTIQVNTSIAESGSSAVTAIRGPAAQTFVVWSTGAVVRAAVYNQLGVQAVAPFDVETVTGAEVLTGYALPDDTGISLYYQINAAQTYNHDVRTVTITNSGSVGTPENFVRGVGIGTKAVKSSGATAFAEDALNRGFIGLVHESTLQSTYFIARNDGLIVARVASGFAGGLNLRPQAPTLNEVTPGVFLASVLTKGPVVADGGNEFLTFKNVSSVKVDITDQSTFSSVQLGNNAHILGGALSVYDGHSLVEGGFHLYPENVSASQTTGGDLTLLGAYQYQVVYQWTDAQKQIHRSAPSAPLTVTLTGSNNRIELTIPTLRVTAKKAPRTNVEIVVFRTEANQTLFYRASSPTTLTYNDPTVQSISVVDNLSDTALVGREPLYTTGDVLENDPPPASSFGTIWKRRVVLGGTEDGSIAISKENFDGQPVEFSNDLTVTVEKEGGEPTGVAALLDKLLIFKESSISYIYGDGPDSRGIGQWTTPESLTTDVGCISANSIAETPTGVVFQSRKGIYEIRNDLSLNYIGAAVEDYNGETVTAAVVHQDRNEVRFATLTVTLVYNYFFQQWSVFTDCGANDAIVWQNRYVYIRRRLNDPALTVCEEEGFFQDVDRFYPMRIGLDFTSFSGIAGFQRIWALLFLGTFKSLHSLRIQLAYDFNEAFEGDYIWEPNDYLGASVYGGSDPYGSEPVFGGTSQPYLVKLKPERQKCTSIRVLLEDINPEGSGESFDLTSISVELGIKRGSAKLPADARI